jgi:hypothetical protein
LTIDEVSHVGVGVAGKRWKLSKLRTLWVSSFGSSFKDIQPHFRRKRSTTYSHGADMRDRLISSSPHIRRRVPPD